MPERQVAVKPVSQKPIYTSARFVNYAARYPGQSKPSLEKLNFEIKYGSLLGVIGKNLNSVNMQGYYMYVYDCCFKFLSRTSWIGEIDTIECVS